MENSVKNVDWQNAMKRIIARFMQTPHGFICGENDRLGMYNFLKRQEVLAVFPEWKQAFEDVKADIQVIISFVSREMRREKVAA